jgi:hypothetical protein
MSGRRRDASARPTTARMTSSPRSTPRNDAPSQVSPRTQPADDGTTGRHIRYDMTIDTHSPSRSRTSANADRISSPRARGDGDSAQGPLSPTTRRRSTRAATFKTVDGDDEFDIELPLTPGLAGSLAQSRDTIPSCRMADTRQCSRRMPTAK